MAPKKSTPFKRVNGIDVWCWGKKVGAVVLDPSLNFYVFEYYPSWVRTGAQLAPLQMPASAGAGPSVFTDLDLGTYRRLPAMLADALPDKFGNALVDR